MIKPLTVENDKIEMLPVIKLINDIIASFFNEKNSRNNLNINGSWGSGKTTIISNLEMYYEDQKTVDNIKWVIINLWEYETTLNPYISLIKDILLNIIGNELDLATSLEKSKTKKIWKWFANLSWTFPPIVGVKLQVRGEYETGKENFKDLDTLTNAAIEEINSIIKKDNKNIVIIFDELDRCTPDNQIKFLSYIKNIYFKIVDIFYIIASNNNLINSYINNNNDDFQNLELEKYTDKIFDMKMNLKHLFASENYSFTENDYIREFCNIVGEINPRMLNKMINQVSINMVLLQKNDEDFKFLQVDMNNESFKKQVYWKIEFILFYCCYLKNRKTEEYKKIINLRDFSIYSHFFVLIKKNIFSKLNNDIQWTSNLHLKQWILNIKSSDDNDNPIYFAIKYNEEKDGFDKETYDFPTFIPFFGYYFNDSNINNIFSIPLYTPSGNKSDKYKRPLLNLEKVNLTNHSKLFFDILFRRIVVSGQVYNLGSKINYQKIRKLIDLSLLYY